MHNVCLIFLHTTSILYCISIDEFAIAMRAPRNVRIVDELVPENFQKFYQETIRRKLRIFRAGNVFPILEFRHFE